MKLRNQNIIPPRGRSAIQINGNWGFYMNRGYAGYYSGFYLRSSYEYAYARFLDHMGVKWTYETETYKLGSSTYKPDFFIYNENNKLIKIVEIKSRQKTALTSAIILLEKVSKKINVECQLLSYRDLLDIYKKFMPCSLNFTIQEWINSPETTINKTLKGKLNPHFSLKHNTGTKKLIGEHTKKLWESNSSSKERMKEGLRKSGLSQKGKIKVPRVERICVVCGNKFKCLVTSKRKNCKQKCAAKINIQRATEQYVFNRQQVKSEIKSFVIEWAKNNKELVMNTPFNKIKTNLAPLMHHIQLNFGVKDFRVISASIFGEDKGRKKFLKFMKNTVSNSEKIC